MRTIDAHIHLGASRISGANFEEQELLRAMERYGISGMCVLPLPEPYPDSPGVHDRIAALCNAYPGKFWGIADVNPRIDEDAYKKEITRCVKELGFVAIKMHPYVEGTMPLLRHATKVYETAQELNVPVLVHTGLGAPQALPSYQIPRAKEFPDVKIVLAHAGGVYYFEEALITAQECPNIYLEMSWCGAHQLKTAIKTIGVERLIFASDHPLNIVPELAKAEALDLSAYEQERYLHANAEEVYVLRG